MPSIIHKTWDLSATMFDGDDLAGMVPTIFADDPDRMVEALNRDLLKVRALHL